MKRALFGIVIVAGALAAFGQRNTGEAQDDIIVPELELEVEELAPQRLTIDLPTEEELELDALSLPLPEAGALPVSEDAFFVDVPAGRLPEVRESSIYSNGRLGAGSVSHIVGDITVFKLGPAPRFRLFFGYEGMDGFQGRRAGTGYFRTVNTIQGSFEGENDEFQLEVNAAYAERENGLQGQSAYFSVGHRGVEADASVSYTPEPVFSLDGTLSASWNSRLLTRSGIDDPPRDQEILFDPVVSAALTIGPVEISLGAEYSSILSPGGAVSGYQSTEFFGGVVVDPDPRFSAHTRAGLLWEFGSPLRYPWEVGFNALVGDALDLALSGGRSYSRPTYATWWEEVPLLAADTLPAQSEIALNEVWEVTGELGWSSPTGFLLQAGLGYRYETGAIDLSGFHDSSSVILFSQREARRVLPAVEIGFRPGRQLQAQVGWTAAFGDAVTPEPEQSLEGSVEYRTADERFSLGGRAQVDFYPEAGIPWLTLFGSAAIADGVDLEVELADLIAPLFQAGRPSTGAEVNEAFPFLEPGFRATILTRISL